MPCATCGAPTTITESEGGTKSGNFREVYECAQGHSGRISGDAGDPPQSWRRSGAVFEDYGGA